MDSFNAVTSVRCPSDDGAGAGPGGALGVGGFRASNGMDRSQAAPGPDSTVKPDNSLAGRSAPSHGGSAIWAPRSSGPGEAAAAYAAISSRAGGRCESGQPCNQCPCTE